VAEEAAELAVAPERLQDRARGRGAGRAARRLDREGEREARVVRLEARQGGEPEAVGAASFGLREDGFGLRAVALAADLDGGAALLRGEGERRGDRRERDRDDARRQPSVAATHLRSSIQRAGAVAADHAAFEEGVEVLGELTGVREAEVEVARGPSR
jgi:hypothetical protein